MTQSNPQPLEIDVVPRARQADALWLLFSATPREFRTALIAATLGSVNRGEAELTGFFEAKRGQQLVATIWGNLLAGHAALVWPPQRIEGEDANTSQRLLETLHLHLQQNDVSLAQAVLQSEDQEGIEALLGCGYQQAAELLYMACQRAQLDREEPVCAELQFEAFSEDKLDRLARVVKATYEATMDCPTLNGVRDMDDVLTGYRATGVYDPQHWFIVRHDGKDIGCLLLADHPRDEQMELVYMGIVPQGRGRQWGQIISRYAQWVAHRTLRQRLVLAVDEANQPARFMYEAAGFTVFDRRRVLLRTL